MNANHEALSDPDTAMNIHHEPDPAHARFDLRYFPWLVLSEGPVFCDKSPILA